MGAKRIKERRRRQRIDSALRIKIEYNKKRILTRTKNISVLGTYIEIERKIPLGTDLHIQLRIPRAGPGRLPLTKQISLSGSVFRCQPIASAGLKRRYGIGIFFRSFSPGGERHLSRFIERTLWQEERRGKIFMRQRKKLTTQQKGGRK